MQKCFKIAASLTCCVMCCIKVLRLSYFSTFLEDLSTTNADFNILTEHPNPSANGSPHDATQTVYIPGSGKKAAQSLKECAHLLLLFV